MLLGKVHSLGALLAIIPIDMRLEEKATQHHHHCSSPCIDLSVSPCCWRDYKQCGHIDRDRSCSIAVRAVPNGPVPNNWYAVLRVVYILMAECNSIDSLVIRYVSEGLCTEHNMVWSESHYWTEWFGWSDSVKVFSGSQLYHYKENWEGKKR